MATIRSFAARTALTLCLIASGSSYASAQSCPAPSGNPPGTLPYPALPVGRATTEFPQITHFVILMMENHSFDNYLGLHAGVDGFTTNGVPTNSNPDTNGNPVVAFHQPVPCEQQQGPSQSWNASHESWNKGANDGFVKASGTIAMGYWTAQDLPFYEQLASTFPIGDAYFGSVQAQTYPNRDYLIAATSLGRVDDALPGMNDHPPNGTIFDELSAHHLTWKDYFTDLPTIGLFPYLLEDYPGQAVPTATFFADAAGGTLPDVSIVETEYELASEEDPQDIQLGQTFSWSVVTAVLNGADWMHTALILVYDEHGGYYDHVPPPAVTPPDTIPPNISATDIQGCFDHYGFRVPAYVISPWSKSGGYVSHVVFDHTSILATLERKWNLPALTYRDANATPLTDFFDFSTPAFSQPPQFLPPQNLAQGAAACAEAGRVPAGIPGIPSLP